MEGGGGGGGGEGGGGEGGVGKRERGGSWERKVEECRTMEGDVYECVNEMV